MSAALTERMRQVLDALARLEEAGVLRAKPSRIAWEVARVEGAFPRITSSTGGAHRNRGVRVMNDAQRFISPVAALERRGFIRYAGDGEYALMTKGRRAQRLSRAAKSSQ